MGFSLVGQNMAQGGLDLASGFVSDFWPLFVVIVGVIAFGYFLGFWRR